MSKFLKSIGLFFLDFIEVLVTSFAIFVVVYLIFFQPHKVRGVSMMPNFQDNEHLLTDKITYRFRKPKRGEIVIFRSPTNEDYDYIKRIIGLPGEKISLENNEIYIDNKKLNEPYLDKKTEGGQFLQNGETIAIPENQYFMIGDNRDKSSDSRSWGFVPKENIIGKAWFRYWPPQRVGFVKNAEY